MKRLAWCVAAVVLLSWTAGGVWAQEQKAQLKQENKAGKPKDKTAEAQPAKPKGALAKMGEVVKLTDEQKTTMAALEEALSKDLKAFQTENQEKFSQLEKAIKEARAKGDKEAISKLDRELAELKAKRELITKSYNDKILAVLTPEQKAKWLEHLVLTPVLEKLKPANLTADQIDKIKAAYVQKTTGLDLSTPENRAKAGKALLEYARANVLTAEQQEKLKADKPKATVQEPKAQAQEKPKNK